MSRSLILVSILGAHVVIGCSRENDREAASNGAAQRPHICEEIEFVCRAVDHGDGRAHECRSGAEATWSEVECGNYALDCFNVCSPPKDAGANDS
jgi:hypothetical protein